MNEPLLSLESADVEAAGVALLQGLSIDLGQGHLLGLHGPSGCGKSTLLRCVAGLSDFASGALRLQGKLPAEIGWPAFRRRVALVAQQPALLDATVEINLARPFGYRIADRPFPRDEASDLLELLDVGKRRMDQAARSLSVGQQQRVCLIRALLLRPDVLLLDEPTSALDDESAEAVEDLLRESVAEGRCDAILLFTHDTTQIDRLCDDSLDLSPHVVSSRVMS